MHVTLLVATLVFAHNGFTTVYLSCICNYSKVISIVLSSLAICIAAILMRRISSSLTAEFFCHPVHIIYNGVGLQLAIPRFDHRHAVTAVQVEKDLNELFFGGCHLRFALAHGCTSFHNSNAFTPCALNLRSSISKNSGLR